MARSSSAVSGGEAGIRGFLDAYDAETGERVWRFWTIPGPGEPGHDTWGGDSSKHGAGATWLTGSYDPELDLLYWGLATRGPTGTVTFVRATISTHALWSHSSQRRGNCAGTSSTPHTTFTTGMLIRSRYW